MSHFTHKRRPTSIAADIQANMYVAAGGEVLQSSMVKEGSPSKRRLTGSTSQVRFTLPAGSDTEDEPTGDDDGDQEDEGDAFVTDADWEDVTSFDNKMVFNTESHAVIEPPRGRQTNIDRYEVSQSLRELVSTSPQRSRLFIRPNSELNKMSIAIPVEAQLPPPLSPQNKIVKRPASLIFNGVDYEPLELSFISAEYLGKKVLMDVPALEKIMIPDLNKPFRTRPLSLTVDNEKEIANPSATAKRLNNDLNRRFSFPPRVRTEIELPPIPVSKVPTIARPPKTTEGLGIFSDVEQSTAAKETDGSPLGRFAAISRSRAMHRHQRCRSVVDAEVEIPTIPQDIPQAPEMARNSRIERTHPTVENSTVPQKIPMAPIMTVKVQTQRAEPMVEDAKTVPHLLPQILPPRSLPPVPRLTSPPRRLPQVPQPLTKPALNDDMLALDDTRSILSVDSISTNDSAQLSNLRDLIITSAGDLTLTRRQIERMDKSIARQSHIYDEPRDAVYELPKSASQQEIPQQYFTVPAMLKEKHYDIVGYHQKHRIYTHDTLHDDRVRTVSQTMRNRKSPMLSQSSYESEVSEPFSQTSAMTEGTVYSGQGEDTPNITYSMRQLEDISHKGKSSARSFLEELDSGEFRETIEIDDETDDDETDDDSLEEIMIVNPPGHSRALSAFSTFSFDNVASQVHIRDSASESVKGLRRYTSKRKSVMELCDDSMASTQDVIASLKRQRKLLIQRQNELMQERKSDREELGMLRQLQEGVERVHTREMNLQRQLTAEQVTLSDQIDQSNRFDHEEYDFQSWSTTIT